MSPIDALLSMVLTIMALVVVILTRVLALLLAWVPLVRVCQTGPALPRRVLRGGRGCISTGTN